MIRPSLSQGARTFHGMHSAKLMEVKRKRFVVCSLLRKCQESFEIPRWLIRKSSRVSAWFKKSRCLWSIRRMILILELHDTQLKKGFQCNSNSNTSASQQQWAAHISALCSLYNKHVRRRAANMSTAEDDLHVGFPVSSWRWKAPYFGFTHICNVNLNTSELAPQIPWVEKPRST